MSIIFQEIVLIVLVKCVFFVLQKYFCMTEVFTDMFLVTVNKFNSILIDDNEFILR